MTHTPSSSDAKPQTIQQSNVAQTPSPLLALGVTPPKGFRDILPAETLLRDKILNLIVDTYRSYGFERIETPVVEDLRRLQHSEGGENLGLMFKILKRGDRLDVKAGVTDPDALADLALRYDLTVPLSRYYANNRGSLPSVFKAIQIGSVWRAERPQHGRYRQFTQCDIDVIGGRSPFDEIELITVTLDVLGQLGIQGATVRLNDRRILNAMVARAGIPDELTNRALVALDKLDKIGLTGVKEDLRNNGFNEEQANRFVALAEEIADKTLEGRLAWAQRELNELLPPRAFHDLGTIIKAVNMGQRDGNRVLFDPFLVRGMGYYTGPVFEIQAPGFTGSIAGGGRYDKLIGKLSGRDASACGFSIGFERLVSILGDAHPTNTGTSPKVAVFFDEERDSVEDVVALVQKLRHGGAVASMYCAPKNLKGAIERLKQSGYSHVVRYSAGQSTEPREIA